MEFEILGAGVVSAYILSSFSFSLLWVTYDLISWMYSYMDWMSCISKKQITKKSCLKVLAVVGTKNEKWNGKPVLVYAIVQHPPLQTPVYVLCTILDMLESREMIKEAAWLAKQPSDV